MEFSRWNNFLVVMILSAGLSSGLFFVSKNIEFVSASQTAGLAGVVNNIPLPPPPPEKLANPPTIFRAIYATGYSAGNKKYLDYLTNLFKNTQINSVVVDIKGSDGYVTYNSEVPEVAKFNLNNNAILNIDDLIRFFHNQNIYVIGRIAVFEDPQYSKARPELAIYNKLKTTDIKNPVLWKDNNNLAWLDPSSKEVWAYDLSLAKNGFYHGFDEINFDYVRFPSDGKPKDMGFPVSDPKVTSASVIKEFFEYLRGNLVGQTISVDVFGQTTVNKDDMGIGQIIENAFENFDYVAPMVYPSHYINGFDGFINPAEHPYEVVKYCMDSALDRQVTFDNIDLTTPDKTKFRPWLQDFNMGAIYNANMVDQQIKALKDSLGDNYTGFMLWNPRNIYTQDAIVK